MRGVVGLDAASGRVISGRAILEDAPRLDDTIHTVLSAPARASRLDEAPLDVVVHAAMRTGEVGKAPFAWTSGRKGMTKGGSVIPLWLLLSLLLLLLL